MKDYPDEFWGRPKAGKTLIIGAKVYPNTDDRRGLYTDVIGLDMQEGEGVDMVHDMESGPAGLFDHIECISVLEHTPRPWLAAHHIEASMVPGATIWLSVPHMWRVHGYPSDYWRFTIEAVISLFPRIKWRGLEYVSHGEIVKRPRRHRVDGKLFFSRTEIIGTGVRC